MKNENPVSQFFYSAQEAVTALTLHFSLLNTLLACRSDLFTGRGQSSRKRALRSDGCFQQQPESTAFPDLPGHAGGARQTPRRQSP